MYKIEIETDNHSLVEVLKNLLMFCVKESGKFSIKAVATDVTMFEHHAESGKKDKQ